MIACISSLVGASTNAKPFDSWVSWFRITLTASATKSSAASHCLMSSAVTHVGRLPRKTVKLIQFYFMLRWLDLRDSRGGFRSDRNSIVPESSSRLQTKFAGKVEVLRGISSGGGGTGWRSRKGCTIVARERT